MSKVSKKNGRSPAANRLGSVRADEIKFYRSNEKPYGVFSNLYPSPVHFEGKNYPTAEHAYQAGKARKPEVREWILAAPTPALAAMAAHGLYTWDVVADWSQAMQSRCAMWPRKMSFDAQIRKCVPCYLPALRMRAELDFSPEGKYDACRSFRSLF